MITVKELEKRILTTELDSIQEIPWYLIPLWLKNNPNKPIFQRVTKDLIKELKYNKLNGVEVKLYTEDVLLSSCTIKNLVLSLESLPFTRYDPRLKN